MIFHKKSVALLKAHSRVVLNTTKAFQYLQSIEKNGRMYTDQYKICKEKKSCLLNNMYFSFYKGGLINEKNIKVT
jgi:hypothetical protein